MDQIQACVAELKRKRTQIDTAIRALEEISEKPSKNLSIVKPFVKPHKTMSAEARANMSKAQQARWHKKKKAA